MLTRRRSAGECVEHRDQGFHGNKMHARFSSERHKRNPEGTQERENAAALLTGKRDHTNLFMENNIRSCAAFLYSNFPLGLRLNTEKGWTALHYACKAGRHRVVAELIQEVHTHAAHACMRAPGLVVSERPWPFGKVYVHTHARTQTQPDLYVNQRTPGGCSGLYLAAEVGHDKVARVLTQQGRGTVNFDCR